MLEPAFSLVGAVFVYVCLRDMRSSLWVKACTCVSGGCVFTWPRSVWVFVCLLVSLCGCGVEGALFCPLPVLSCGTPAFSCSENQLVVGWAGQAHCRVRITSERPVCAAAFLLASASTLPYIPQFSGLRLALGDSGDSVISPAVGYGAIGEGCKIAGGQCTLIPAQGLPGPRHPRIPQRAWEFSRGPTGDRSEYHIPCVLSPSFSVTLGVPSPQ